MNSSGAIPIRVGLVGASPNQGWGTAAHLPALATLAEFSVVAVATTRAESAQKTADEHGIPLAFADSTALAAHDDVDLVVVAVRAPSHAEVVRVALEHGKHVYCEWPLGVDLVESTDLADRAASAGVVHAIGLQGRRAPATRYVRDLLRSGHIGTVHAVSVVGFAGMNGSRIASGVAWAAQPKAGVDNLTISGGHILATLDEIYGEVRVLSSVVRNTNHVTTITETGQILTGLPPNQVVIAGTVGDAVLSLVVQGGNPPVAGGFHASFMGTDGSLTITPTYRSGSMWIAGWNITAVLADGSVQTLPIPQEYRESPDQLTDGPAMNVAAMYREIASAVREGRDATPNFATARRIHLLLRDVTERAAG